MEKKPAILSQRIVASSRLFKVEELQLRFSNGEERTYERLAGGMRAGAVMVVAMLDKEHFVMIDRDYQLSNPTRRGLPNYRPWSFPPFRLFPFSFGTNGAKD